MRPTPVSALVVAALFGGLAGWLVVIIANAFDLVPPQVPWTAPAGVGGIAALVGALAYTTRMRIHERHERIEPERAVAFLVLGKAAALGGALVAGGYLVFALMFLARIEAESPRERVIRSVAAALAGLVLLVAGLRLEKACAVPKDDPDDDSSQI